MASAPLGRTRAPNGRLKHSVFSFELPERIAMPLGRIENESACIVSDTPAFVEQRWHADAVFSPEAVERNQQAIDDLADGQPYVLMNIFPSAMQVSMELMNKDHYRERRDTDPVIAIATVVGGETMLAATRLYFMFHPQPFPVGVFEEERDAREWLERHLHRG